MIAQTVPNALTIPESAVLTSPSGSASVIVVDSENKPHKKGVTLGVHGSMAEVDQPTSSQSLLKPNA